MKIATWNVNGINTRLPQLLAWLAKESPDVACLQELKTEDKGFPRGALEKAGYGALCHGQRAWNGVAILVKGAEPLEVRRGLAGDTADEQSRYLEAAVDGILVACLYLPNGNPQPGPKFAYKLAWFERLIRDAQGLWDSGVPAVLAGDFNVVPTDFDIYNPASWKKDALLQPETRAAYARLLKQGWTDALRARHPDEAIFTFWDYFRNHWNRNAGLRIDHLLLSKQLSVRLVDANVDRWVRGEPHASDHAPVWVDIGDGRSSRAPAAARKGGSMASKKRPSLDRYVAKRNFTVTPEPRDGGKPSPDARQFVIQKHWASRLHYDFRLELDGTMKSWAVPKGPSFDPKDKRMAVHVEDHPISYNAFEGKIPEKQYGAGKVIIWDKGIWTPVGDPREGYRKGNLKFTLQGHKLHGAWVLVRMKSREPKQDAWLLIKEKDGFARPAAEFSVTDELPDSVAGLPAARSSQRSKSAAAPAAKAKPGRRKSTAATSMPEGATRKAAPATLKPVLATLVDAPPPRPGEWLYEVKFDGYRILARIEAKRVRLITRNGHDWTDKLEHLARALQSMSLKPSWLDGEIVMLGDKGATSFQQLQNAFDSARTADIVYFLFDLPYYDGYDLTGVPLVERRALLQSLLQNAPPQVRFSDAFEAAPDKLVTSACKLGLEGIIGKRRQSTYSSRRSPDWIKLKCGQRQEFVVGGWTDPQGSRTGLGALLVGVHNAQGELVYAGKVGSGFDEASLARISGKLKRLASKKSPFKDRVPEAGKVHWVKPALVAELTFSEWTGSGHLRHPVFHALRTDKPAKAIVREDPVTALGPDVEEPQSLIPARLKVSNPERIVDATTGVTKIGIIRYYALVGELMMEHLRGRPVSLVKAPQGLKQPMFFQKHAEKSQMEDVVQLDRKLDPKHPPYLEIVSPLGLLAAAQMNVIEFHTWNAVKSAFHKPDRMVFDLDPGEGASWSAVQQGAELMRGFLDELQLPAWLKTSGGKGLHIVTPIEPQYDWDTVKSFSQAIVMHMAEVLPRLFVAKSGPRNRVGKVFIDYLRNGFGATTVCAWSARARAGLGISVPVTWAELPKLKSGAQWSVKNGHLRLAEGNGPWKDYPKSARPLGAAMKALGFKAPQLKSAAKRR